MGHVTAANEAFHLQLGDVLGAGDGDTLQEPSQIAAALLLYRQWPDHRKALVHWNGLSRRCEMIMSDDEAVPTEIRLKVFGAWSFAAHIRITFEVFHVAYQFTAVLQAVDNHNADEPEAIVATPGHLVVAKMRAMPRFRLGAAEQARIGTTKWRTPDHQVISFSLLEMGVDSIRAEFGNGHELTGDDGEILVGKITVPARIIRRDSTGAILRLQFATAELYGRYFNIYASVAFPTIRERTSAYHERTLQTYRDAGFFSKFLKSLKPEEQDSVFKSILETWQGMESGAHVTHADYCSVDETDRVVGASSTVLAFFNGPRPVWALHQMAALKEGERFANTRELYEWRPHFLSGSQGEFDVIVWFDGNSRWIERIWLKFNKSDRGSTSTVWPITIRIYRDCKPLKPAKVETKAFRIGSYERTVVRQPGLMAGIDPTFLNPSKVLNHIVSVPPGNDISIVSESIDALCKTGESAEFRVSMAHGYSDPQFDQLPIHGSNRLIYFGKESLGYLASSLAHSLAVVNEKNRASRS